MTREEEKYTTLDTEQCKWWVNLLFNMAKEKACNSHNFDDAQEIQSAQDKIIKALEQKPCEPCEDIAKAFQFGLALGFGEKYDEMDKVMEEVKKAVTPTPRKGKWIPRNSFLLQYKCSECGQESEKYNYCPNCGADMRM